MASAVPRFVSIAIALAMAPFVVSQLGLETYGFWALLLGVVQYALIMDGGLPIAAMSLVSRRYAAGDMAGVQAAVEAVAVVAMALGIVLVCLVVVAVSAIPQSVVDDWPDGAPIAIALTAINVVGLILASAFAAGVRGMQRFDAQAWAIIGTQLLGAALTVGFLLGGGGLAGVAAANALAAWIYVLFSAIQAWRVGAFSLRPQRLDRETLRLLRGQGANLQLVAFVGATNAQADRYFLLPFVPLSWIGAYDLGSRVANAVRALPLAALGPIIARMGAELAANGIGAVRPLYCRLSVVVARYAVSPMILLYLCAFPGVLAWLGPDFTISATAAVVLGLGYALNMATAPGTTTAIASGRAELDRNYCLLGLAINLVATAVLGVAFGGWGVVAATTIGLVVSSAWLVETVGRWLDVNSARIMVKQARWELLSSSLIGGANLAVALTMGLSRPLNALVAVVGVFLGAIAIAWPVRRRLLEAARGFRHGPSTAVATQSALTGGND